MALKYVYNINVNFLNQVLTEGNCVVFGDNCEKWGKGGQAKYARDYSIAIGIPTKINPYVYFDNSKFSWDLYVKYSYNSWIKIKNYLEEGKIVYWPESGIGIGRAKLFEKSPIIYNDINLKLSRIINKYGVIDNN